MTLFDKLRNYAKKPVLAAAFLGVMAIGLEAKIASIANATELKKVTVFWTKPVVYEDGSPLDPSTELAGYPIYTKVGDGPWRMLINVPESDCPNNPKCDKLLTFSQTDIPIYLKIRAMDNNGTVSKDSNIISTVFARVSSSVESEIPPTDSYNLLEPGRLLFFMQNRGAKEVVQSPETIDFYYDNNNPLKQSSWSFKTSFNLGDFNSSFLKVNNPGEKKVFISFFYHAAESGLWIREGFSAESGISDVHFPYNVLDLGFNSSPTLDELNNNSVIDEVMFRITEKNNYDKINVLDPFDVTNEPISEGTKRIELLNWYLE